MPLTTATQLDALIAARTAPPHSSLPRLVVAAARGADAAPDALPLYLGLGGTAQLPPSPADAPGPALVADDAFVLASCSKLVTTVAVLQLVERGMLELEQDVREVMPALGMLKRLDGFGEEGEPVLRDDGVPVTVRMLLTHTAVSVA